MMSLLDQTTPPPAELERALAESEIGKAHIKVIGLGGGGSNAVNRMVRVGLDAANAEDALLASGTIPLVASPVRGIAGAPPGIYWDGALIDYHLLLPYQRRRSAERIVFYPHFNDFVTPGWLDKHLPWRRSPRTHPWLDDMLLVAPSPAFLATLPNGKLPERQDFYRYGPDHAGRIRAWETAIAECGRFAAAVLGWMERPDPTLIEPI